MESDSMDCLGAHCIRGYKAKLASYNYLGGIFCQTAECIKAAGTKMQKATSGTQI